MNQCNRCEGFVPAGLELCPNCSSTRRAWWRIPLAIAGAGIASVTLSACYGAACTVTLPDGTIATARGDTSCNFDCRDPLPDGGVAANDPSWTQICIRTNSGDGGTLDGGDGG